VLHDFSTNENHQGAKAGKNFATLRWASSRHQEHFLLGGRNGRNYDASNIRPMLKLSILRAKKERAVPPN
jgi:hypothetical protein